LDLRQGILDSAGIEGAKERKGGSQQLIEKLKKNS
jgi:hypothetical protein